MQNFHTRWWQQSGSYPYGSASCKFYGLIRAINTWITEQKLPTFMELGTFSTHILKITVTTFFFVRSKCCFYSDFSVFIQLYRVK
jgi:hypothetical protein